MNIAVALEMAAECHPERVAIRSGGRNVTYGELHRAARAAADKIREAQVQRVGLLDTNGLAAPIALFGAAFAGVPYVPMNYRLTKDEIEALLRRISPALVVVGDAFNASLVMPDGIQTVPSETFYRDALVANPSTLVAPGAPDDVAIQIFTSGTTGKPKAAVLRHENVMSYILGTVEFASAAVEDSILISVPPYHIAGISAVLSSTYAGRRMVQLPNFDPQAWLQLCREERVTNAFVVPTMLSRIVDQLGAHAAGTGPSSLRAIAYGGGKMPLGVIEQAIKHFPDVDFTNAYGLTETSSTICLLGPDDHRSGMASDDPLVRRRLTSVGKPVPTVELQVRGENDEVLGPGEPGELFVRGAQVAGEYLEQGSLLDPEGWFPTRDRGSVDEFGFVYLEGRADDVIVRGGENISPGEIEGVLLEHPAISDAACVAVPDREWGESVGAVLVLKAGATVQTAQLQDWVKQRLRSSRVPTTIRFVDELPYNEMGKVLRRVLKQQFALAPA